MSLSKKMLRDIKINKTQFIAIFLMAFLGIFAYSGIYGEYYGLVQTSNEFYGQTNIADGWIYNTDFDDSTLDKVNGFSTQSERQEVVQSVADMENQPDIKLHFTEKGKISKFYTTDGEDFNVQDESGVWLDKRFADARELHVGDNITFEFDNLTITKEIRGLGYSPEYVFQVSPSSLTPDFNQMGFGNQMLMNNNPMMMQMNMNTQNDIEDVYDVYDYIKEPKKKVIFLRVLDNKSFNILIPC